MRFIGDVHAKFEQYVELIRDCPASIQVGDFGVGFRTVPVVGPTHRFIRGNHDDPGAVARHNWIKDGTVEGDMMFVGGGESIDRSSRTEGRDWWPDEQLSMAELYEMMDIYDATKPRIMVTHECPSDIAMRMFNFNEYRRLNPSRTSQALAGMWSQHQPQYWIHGHWHQRRIETYGATTFICLEELGIIDL